MWPVLLDMTRDECKRVLRRLELEAYSSLVSAFRAQGKLSKVKQKLLQDLASTLNISLERHKAEIRRAANDEKLGTIAERIAGPNTAPDWAIEGRRLVPLMPRLVPQTAFTALANNAASIAATENAKLPPPASTLKKNVPEDDASWRETNISEAARTPQRASSPVTVTQSATLLRREDEERRGRKRQHSVSLEETHSPTLLPPKIPAMQPPKQLATRTVSFPLGVSPGKINLTSTPTRAGNTTTSATGTTQKVIIVSSSPAPGSPSILQRSLSVPIVKTVSAATSANTVTQPRNSLLVPSLDVPGPSNVVTISTNPCSAGSVTATTVSPMPAVSIGGVPTSTFLSSQAGMANTTFLSNQGGLSKVRPKTVQLSAPLRPRLSSRPIVQQHPAIRGSCPTLQLKHDGGGMKIVPVSSSTTKILPKPMSPVGQSPVYVMSTTTAGVSVVTQGSPPTASHGTAQRIMSLNTLPGNSSQGRPAATVSKAAGKMLPALHLPSRPVGAKPNVIVLQKGGVGSYARGITLSQGGTVLMGKSLAGHTVTVQKGGLGSQPLQLPAASAQGNVIVVDLSQDQLNKNSVLAEFLHASGILGADSKQQPAREETLDEVTIPAGQVVALEEAVEVLGQSDVCALLNPPAVQLASCPEVVGQLDPQTGVYSTHTSTSDIFTTALASANINLDAFQYMEDDQDRSKERTAAGKQQAVTAGQITTSQQELQVQSEEEQIISFTTQPEIVTAADCTAVMVEPSHMDTTGMLLEDFTSQKLQGESAI